MARAKTWKYQAPKPVDLATAENLIVRITQQQHFKKEIDELKAAKNVRKMSKLASLDPRTDSDGILRIGGRTQKSTSLTLLEKHPAILPKDSHLSQLLIEYHQGRVHHQGRNSTIAAIRMAGYWIVDCKAWSEA